MGSLHSKYLSIVMCLTAARWIQLLDWWMRNQKGKSLWMGILYGKLCKFCCRLTVVRLWSAYEGVLKVQSNGSALTGKTSAKKPTTAKHTFRKREWQTTKFNGIMTSKRGKCSEREKKLARNHINKSWMQREVEWNKLNLHINIWVCVRMCLQL